MRLENLTLIERKIDEQYSVSLLQKRQQNLKGKPFIITFNINDKKLNKEIINDKFSYILRDN